MVLHSVACTTIWQIASSFCTWFCSKKVMSTYRNLGIFMSSAFPLLGHKQQRAPALPISRAWWRSTFFFFIHITKRSEGQVRDLQPSVSLQKSSELIHPLQPLTHQLLKPLGQQAVGHFQRWFCTWSSVSFAHITLWKSSEAIEAAVYYTP